MKITRNANGFLQKVWVDVRVPVTHLESSGTQGRGNTNWGVFSITFLEIIHTEEHQADKEQLSYEDNGALMEEEKNFATEFFFQAL